MSAAAAATDATDVPKKKGSKKLLIIIGAVVLLLAVGGGGAFYMMQKRAAEAAAAAAAEAEDGEEAAPKAAHAKKDGHVVPTFLPLEAFVVNLADRDQDRFAQIGITLQVDDAKVADELKAYMPAIRNGVLLILSQKTSAELLDRAGKEKLAKEIMRESVRPLGIELDEEEEDAHAGDKAADEKPKKKKKKAAAHNPVEQVHFSSFIIQ